MHGFDDGSTTRPIGARLRRGCLLAICAVLPLHASAGDFSGGFALSSQLIDRGQPITPATPILQGNLGWTSREGWAFGLAASTRLHAPGGHFLEATAQAARYWSLSGDWSMQASALYYGYPERWRLFDRAEAGLHWTWRDVLTVGVSATSTLHDDRDHLREAADATLHWPLTPHLSLSAGAGVARAFVAPYKPYRYGQAGLTWTQGAWRVEVLRIASDQEYKYRQAYPTLQHWVATLQWSF